MEIGMLKDTNKKLSQAHPDLQRLFKEVGSRIDILIICTFRGQKEQDAAFNDGKSSLKWPKSKHNHTPSLAVDSAPLKNNKIDWNDTKAFQHMCDVIKSCADKLGIKIRQGRDFKKPVDLPHTELTNG
jgi:peptidoglycan LD-endopeptidase CwlK